ncbi:serine protease 27-like [Hyla sarda]|uniref:serine protease 27-like n=1 Tax=Hyla sarda TaxID=327740 RepID=UPI0024C22AC7|nr:serine protease 27-like [Hyla sarda]
MVSQRIVGGADSAPGAWPWQVSIQLKKLSSCGGSLITDSLVLTVAHCLVSMNVSEYTVYLGAHQLSGLQQSGVVARGVKRIIIHPDFTEVGSSGDIALIELEKPVNFTSSILPVCLPSASVKLPEGTLCWATGWGNIKDGERLPKPKTLQEVQLALIDNMNCESMYNTNLGYNPKFKLIQSDMMCAGYKEGKKDTCQGDSGGPLVCSVNGAWMQMGIISWGFGCAEPSHPGVYTRVQYYLPWIQKFVASLPNNNGLNSVHLVDKISTTSPNNSSHSDILFDPNDMERGNVTGNGTEPKMLFLVGNGAHLNLWSMANPMLILLGLLLLL